MQHTKRGILGTALALAAALSTAVAAPAAADAVYRTERLPFVPVGEAPLKSGFVVNAHANGPRIYAQERYVLVGAQPNTTYEVWLNAYLANTTCAGDPSLSLLTAEFTTNTAGNVTAHKTFVPADTAGLGGMTIGGQWVVKQGGTVVYQTPCTAISLD